MTRTSEERERRRGTAAAVTPAAAGALAALAVVTAGWTPAAGQSPVPEAARMVEVVRAVEGIDGMRSSLARAVAEGEEAPDRETFRRVCRPVGQRARRVADEHGWRFQQLSRRYRNPAHAPDAGAREVLRRMEGDPDLSSVWRRTRLEGRPGWRYYRRITVEPACLACHGAEEERPAFVRRAYPDDRAHGFEVGDLRGVYAVFVPADSVPASGP